LIYTSSCEGGGGGGGGDKEGGDVCNNGVCDGVVTWDVAWDVAWDDILDLSLLLISWISSYLDPNNKNHIN
jgi:hypothetical protein